MATQPGPLTESPWHRMGNWKYLLYAPLAAKVAYTRFAEVKEHNDLFLHTLIQAALRHFVGQVCVSLSRWRYLIGRHEIQKKGVTFDEVDHSSNWDDYILLDTFLLAGLFMHPLFGSYKFPMWDHKGMLICVLLHVGPTESIYYWLHRALHNHYLYTRYHSHHHSLFITEANSGTVHPFAEHLMYAAIFSIPVIGTFFLGRISIGMMYTYMLGFDIMNAIGHCNFEFVPEWLFRALPILQYLIYTPSYHSLHHSQVHSNFSLFMPMYDYWGGTVDKNTYALYHSMRQGNDEMTDFVYLSHGMDLLHIFHVALGIQSFSAMPYTPHWTLFPLYPLAILVMTLLWLFGKPFAGDKYHLLGVHGQSWVVPRYTFQYSLSIEKDRINGLIENAIRMAEEEGCRVLCFGMLNKEQNLNGGGSLFVMRNPNLRIRLVTGYTLTAAIVLNRLPRNVQEVFLIGSSEVSRGIAIHLCNRKVRVLLLTNSLGRFEKLQSELPPGNQHFLVNVTKSQAGQQCPVWILEESIEAKDQQWAPPGTHFHQFILAKVLTQTRKDCTYGIYPAMRVPSCIKGLRTCEISMPREVVHACHAAGLVHSLENWKHHEVGPINVEHIDTVWKAALEHGFKCV